MKIASLMLILLAITGFVLGKKVAVFEEVKYANPSFFPLSVDGERIVITSGRKIFVYSADKYKLINVFGGAGEGPGEFMGYDGNFVFTNLTSEHIVVDSYKKVSYFSRYGDLIKEVKSRRGWSFLPIMDGKYLGFDMVLVEGKRIGTVNIYDANLNRLKELLRFQEFFFQEEFNPFAFRKPIGRIYENKIFLGCDDGKIHVFNPEGKKLYVINYDYEKIKVTEAHKKEVLQVFTSDPRLKEDFEQRFKQKLVFPKYLPILKQFNISDGIIYVLTYKLIENKSEFILFDPKGKFLRKMMVPVAHINSAEPFPYTIWDGKIYQLVENPKTEIYELHIQTLPR